MRERALAQCTVQKRFSQRAGQVLFFFLWHVADHPPCALNVGSRERVLEAGLRFPLMSAERWLSTDIDGDAQGRTRGLRADRGERPGGGQDHSPGARLVHLRGSRQLPRAAVLEEEP